MIIRYADVLLMYAEAMNEVLDNPAFDMNPVTIYTAVNRVRQRARYECYTGRKNEGRNEEIIRKRKKG